MTQRGRVSVDFGGMPLGHTKVSDKQSCPCPFTSSAMGPSPGGPSPAWRGAHAAVAEVLQKGRLERQARIDVQALQAPQAAGLPQLQANGPVEPGACAQDLLEPSSGIWNCKCAISKTLLTPLLTHTFRTPCFSCATHGLQVGLTQPLRWLMRAFSFHAAKAVTMTSPQRHMKRRKNCETTAPKSRAYCSSLVLKYPSRLAEPFFCTMALPCGARQWRAAELETIKPGSFYCRSRKGFSKAGMATTQRRCWGGGLCKAYASHTQKTR